MIKKYAGIGSRNTPMNILNIMTGIAYHFSKYDVVLRSGGAHGADTAFEEGCDQSNGKKEIFLPWKDFNDNKSELYNPTKEAYEIARNFHPYWQGLDASVKKLMARNTHQVLGKTCSDPCDIVICWTLNENKGGTSQALRIAKAYNIPIVNINNISVPSLKTTLTQIIKILSK